MSDLVHIKVRGDAAGFYADAQGTRLTSEPLTRDVAEAICRATPNGDQWELVPDPGGER